MLSAIIRAVDDRESPWRCEGPIRGGVCAKAAPGELVGCAGQEIAVLDGETLLALMRVEPNARSCPLAAIGMVSRSAPDRANRGRV